MRLSLFISACTSAVLTSVFAVPLLAQPAPKTSALTVPKAGSFTVVGQGGNRIGVQCKDTKDLGRCMDGVQGLSAQEKRQLKVLVPKLQTAIGESLAGAQDRSGECFTIRVYQYPKGFPEKNAKALPKVSDCTPSARLHTRDLIEGVQVYQMKKH